MAKDPMTEEEYNEDAGRCPFCRSEDVKVEGLAWQDGTPAADGVCKACARQWRVWFTEDGYTGRCRDCRGPLLGAQEAKGGRCETCA